MESAPTPLIHLARGAEKLGEFDLATVRGGLTGGRFLANDLAWEQGMPAWAPLGVVLTRHGVTVEAPAASSASAGLEWILPVNRSGLAIAAGYLGLLSVLIFPAPIALLLGVLALRDLQRHPKKRGRGRAWFGVVMGGLGTLALVVLIITAASKH